MMPVLELRIGVYVQLTPVSTRFFQKPQVIIMMPVVELRIGVYVQLTPVRVSCLMVRMLISAQL